MIPLVEWTTEQDDFIRANPHMPTAQIAEVVGHPYLSTKRRRWQLCGAKDRPTMCRRDDEDYMQRQRKALEGDL